MKQTTINSLIYNTISQIMQANPEITEHQLDNAMQWTQEKFFQDSKTAHITEEEVIAQLPQNHPEWPYAWADLDSIIMNVEDETDAHLDDVDFDLIERVARACCWVLDIPQLGEVFAAPGVTAEQVISEAKREGLF